MRSDCLPEIVLDDVAVRLSGGVAGPAVGFRLTILRHVAVVWVATVLAAHAIGVLAALAMSASFIAFVDALAAIGTLGAGVFAAAQSVRGALAANGLLVIVFAHSRLLKIECMGNANLGCRVGLSA